MDVPTQFSEVVELVAWNIDNLSRHKLVTKADLPMLAAILKCLLSSCDNDDAKNDAIWAMSRLLNTDDQGIELLASNNLIQTLLNLLSENVNKL